MKTTGIQRLRCVPQRCWREAALGIPEPFFHVLPRGIKISVTLITILVTPNTVDCDNLVSGAWSSKGDTAVL